MLQWYTDFHSHNAEYSFCQFMLTEKCCDNVYAQLFNVLSKDSILLISTVQQSMIGQICILPSEHATLAILINSLNNLIV